MDRINATIREAKIEDLVTLKSFEQGIILYERPFAPNLKEDPIEYYDLADLIQRKDACVVVATINEGEIIASGYALIKNEVPYKKHDQYAYLGFMYVLPEFRGKGINGAILDNLVEWAQKRGLSEIQLQVYAENESAINAYKKKGFRPDLLNMRFNVGE